MTRAYPLPPLTDWFPPHVPPSRPGYYDVRVGPTWWTMRRRWDGRRWLRTNGKPVALRLEWRGLSAAPRHPGSELPPAPGWYEVGHDPATEPGPRSKHRLLGVLRYFDGACWRGGWEGELVSIFGTHRSHRWREVRAENAGRRPPSEAHKPPIPMARVRRVTLGA